MNTSQPPKRKLHRLPMPAYAGGGRIFHFTLCAEGPGQPFADCQLADAVVRSLLWTRERYGWKLFCYCLMPEHLHVVLQTGPAAGVLVNTGGRGAVLAGVLDQIGRFKRYTTTQEWWKLGGEGALWQESSYDRAIRVSEDAGQVIAYVLDNPVRRGLVERWEHYPYAAIVDPW